MEIDKIRTTAYKPSTNGVVERFHRTLNSMLGKVISASQRDGDDKLPSVMAAYPAAITAAVVTSTEQLDAYCNLATTTDLYTACSAVSSMPWARITFKAYIVFAHELITVLTCSDTLRPLVMATLRILIVVDQ